MQSRYIKVAKSQKRISITANSGVLGLSYEVSFVSVLAIVLSKY